MKQHFLIADRLKRVNIYLILANIFAGTAAGTAILSKIDESGIWAGLLAISVIIFSSLLLTFNPELTAMAHNDAGNRYLLLKGEARKLKNVDVLVFTSQTSSSSALTSSKGDTGRSGNVAPAYRVVVSEGQDEDRRGRMRL